MSRQILTSDLLSRVEYVSKLSRPYLRERNRRCTTAPSNHGSVYSVSLTIAIEFVAHAQSSIRKTLCQNLRFHDLRNCIYPLHHLVNLFWSLSRPSQRTISQICASRFNSSCGCKYRRWRVFRDQLRPEKVEERCGHWNEDIIGRNYRLGKI